MIQNNNKDILTHYVNVLNTSYNFYVPFMLPKAPTSIVEIKHKKINQGELFNIEVLEGANIEELEQFNIETPTEEEELSNVRYNSSFNIDYEYINTISPDNRLDEIQRLRKEQADKITHAEALNIYYRNELINFNEEIKEEYIRKLSEQEVHAHYQRNIFFCNYLLGTLKNFLF